jgi:hypothetical protein
MLTVSRAASKFLNKGNCPPVSTGAEAAVDFLGSVQNMSQFSRIKNKLTSETRLI